MGRGRYPARLHIAPPTAEQAEKYLGIWPGHEFYREPERFPELSSPALFGNHKPFELDIGCALGDFTCALAQARPDANYVGIDISLKPLHRAVATADTLGLGNVRFLQADMLLAYAKIPPQTLRGAYVHFPAPLLHNHQRKQRLVSPELLRQMQQALIPGGLLSVLTDQPVVYADLLRFLAATPGLRLRSESEYTLANSDLFKSHYYRRWEEQGRPILRAEIEKVA